MTDYISREAALKKQTIITERYHAQGADEEYGHEVVQSEDIRAIPAADVVPVVRCKDCKYINHLPWMDDETGRAVICSKHSFTGLRSDDWYCADGERRE